MKNNNENENIREISKWLENLRFRKQFFGGVSEEDVWKKIRELNDMYQASLRDERTRYDTMIEHYKKTGAESQDGEMAHDK
ncbi:MAG TPA: hypothetical protein GXZ59_08050 [Clostridiaceae bacterium]|nr:hypothetical protein [Clostridiaceae bacterium]